MPRTLTALFVMLRLLVIIALAGAAIPAGAGAARALGAHQVVILVADDFTSPDLADLAGRTYDPGATCAVSLEGQAFAVRGVSAAPIPAPHGELVMAELEELVADANAADFIRLVPVDIHGAATDVVAQRIEDALDAHPADVYMLNMSFALIPCEYLTAFAEFGGQLLSARDAKDLNRYRGIFQRAVLFYDGTVFPVMSQKAQQATDLDPLQSLLADRPDVIPVAAAGNFGLDFPFWPGAWGQVISVSASQGMGYHAGAPWDKKKDTPLLTAESQSPGQQKRISNYGEVMMPGEYASDFGPVSGTSFAAPRLSVALALYASDVGPSICRDSDGNPALASGDWDNRTLQAAAQASCPALAPYLPQP
ncbi:MAG TPA: S8/S53 family peptidase [Aggregatilineaceae bacterium]|jgi:hypothetical protein|nr:S8/S53 family peptidase [Aggregatilineaceae bacterium]